jgi:hypothetical protein
MYFDLEHGITIRCGNAVPQRGTESDSLCSSVCISSVSSVVLDSYSLLNVSTGLVLAALMIVVLVVKMPMLKINAAQMITGTSPTGIW